MSIDWESTFRNWSKPSSDTEKEKCENTERMIHDAIHQSQVLNTRNIKVFAQGSYRNNTNVKQASDVDICVVCYDTFYYDFSFADGFDQNDVGIISATYNYDEYKYDVANALISKFGSQSVNRGNKAFDVHASSYRVDADVVPCFEHRRYTQKNYRGEFVYLSGTAFFADNGQYVINWPQQNYDNGVAKNNRTGGRYKKIVRVLKRLRDKMDAEGYIEAKPISSYLIECLVWNVPDDGFKSEEYVSNVRYALAHLFNETLSLEDCEEWGEVNELKYLWNGQPWTLQQAHSFIDSAWDYIGFE